MSAQATTSDPPTNPQLLSEHISVLYEIEKLSSLISKLKSKRIVLDKRRQSNREALRAVSTAEEHNDIDDDGIWLECSSTMIKFDLETARSYLQSQQEQIELDITSTTSELKRLLRDLQLVAPSKGIDPKSLELILKE